ncbi:MAG: hypothetical protein LBR20_08320 [Propionibacteriaceae bacterium]|jgi:hypothetical protein|nr:hypothetical protein [Propionibacteriaceae bacterium]
MKRHGVAGLVAAIVLATMPAAVAHADDDHLSSYWDGPTYNLSWDGSTYPTVSDTFLGNPVVVPGDDVHRTLKVRNNTDGTCDHALVSVDLFDERQDEPEGSVNHELADLVYLYWDIEGAKGELKFRDAISAGDTRLTTFSLAPGQVGSIKLGYRFPKAATGGQSHGKPSVIESFKVRISATGDCNPGTGGDPDPDPTPSQTSTPTPKPSPSPTGTATPSPSPSIHHDPDDPLAFTGARGWLPYTLGGAVFLIFGFALLRNRRRDD